MPTAVDAAQAAADELHGATIAMYEVRDEFRAGLSQVKVAATQVITSFLKAGVNNYFYDGVNGSDANDGRDVTRSKRSLDAVLDAIEADGTSVFGAVVFILSDAQLRYHHTMPSPVTLIGAEWGGGALGAIYRNVVRTLSFQAEALNSPVPGVGRTTPCIRSLASSLRLASLAVAMPDVPGALDQASLLVMINGGTNVFDQVTLTCATPGSAVSLLAVAAPSTVQFLGTLGSNAPGHVFKGVAAGTNPNNNFAFRTNLVSA